WPLQISGSWGESAEEQRKPKRPPECKALPARNCPYYIVRRSRCGFLTLLLSLYSRVLGGARVPHVGDGVPPWRTLLPSFLLSRKTVSARRRNQHARRVRYPKYCSDARAHRNVTGRLPATAGNCRLAACAPQNQRSGRFGEPPLPKRRALCPQQGPDKVLRSVALQLTRRIPAPSPGESDRSKLCDREKGLGLA